MYNEEDFLQLSALQHFIFCRRQCALIHIEQAWVENLFTAEGRIMHDNVHKEQTKGRKDTGRQIKIERGVALRSDKLGLNGKADAVEFRRGKAGEWMPFPVEYKRGKPKSNDCDRIQLCAQAVCLEEMMNTQIPSGAVFYGKTRRREDVLFDRILREKTEAAAREAHRLIKDGITPKPEYSKKCNSCSLFDLCMPKNFRKSASVENYLKEMLRENEKTA